MIKEIFMLFGSIFKLISKAFYYLFKGVGWYFQNLEKILKNYPRKTKKRIRIKEEIL
jgi:hypothetical protein